MSRVSYSLRALRDQQSLEIIVSIDPSTKITTEELAAKFYITAYRLKKYFPVYTNLTIEDYRKYLLIQKANRDIVKGKGKLKAKDVASQAGYKDRKGFIKGSIRLHSCSPVELENMKFNPDQPLEPEKPGIRVLLNKHFVMTW